MKTIKLTGHFPVKNQKKLVAKEDFLTVVKSQSNNKKTYFAGLTEISKEIFEGMLFLIEKQGINFKKEIKYVNQYMNNIPAVWRITYYNFQ